MSHGNRDMSFFNSINNGIIELPDLLEEHTNSCSAWAFSCPPDSSSDCFVVGFKAIGLDNKTLFVSSGGSYFKTCVAHGLGNKIYFPMFTTIRAFSTVWPIENITLLINLSTKLIQVQIFLTSSNQNPAFRSNQRVINRSLSIAVYFSIN
ncbi:hypothetical protein H5410_060073 [Solanum commersonii]|uniref:Uncharacterized protein n=1 Tax=Solanum commersonii TaxID=4109 RepID=A0A9J5W433_SOLCO|nr:hypothetical protein H5410_060073 [Solanum commersonii]